MVNKARIKAAGLAATALTGLVAFIPSPAEAAGNCTHYAEAGYIQFFTEPNYQGDCYETMVTWRIDRLSDVGMDNKISSLRSWQGDFDYGDPSTSSLFANTDWITGARFQFKHGEWWPTLPSWIDNQASTYQTFQ